MNKSNTLKSTRRLGLDIGVGSIGFSLIDIFNEDEKIVFKNLATNSIIFNAPELALERRKARSARRLQDRKSRRKRHIRNIFCQYGIAEKSFVDSPTDYLNGLNIKDDVYALREKALHQNITKDEFVEAIYSITTRRGYSNQFESAEQDEKDQKENEKINGSISKNIKEIEQKGFSLPSELLTFRRKEKEENGFQNIPVRNKVQGYHNSLNRHLYEQELAIVALSQKENKEIFQNEAQCREFLGKIKEAMLHQRDLKSFEGMVAYCGFYNKYHDDKQKRMPLSSLYNIELTLRQTLQNQTAIDKKTGEIHDLSKEDINDIVAKWIENPSANEITFKNIFSKTNKKDFILSQKGASDTVLTIKGFRDLSAIFKKYDLDFFEKNRELYESLSVVLSYYKSISRREKEIAKVITDNFEGQENFIKEVAKLSSIDGFAAFSQKFAKEVLQKMQSGLSFSESLEQLGYNDKYLEMPAYEYLPPLNTTQADIKWLQEKLPYFDVKHLYYKPNVSKTVERVVSVLRKLVNNIIQTYGKIDEIIIEGGRDLNSDAERKAIDDSQKADNKRNKEAEQLLKSNGIEDYTNQKKIKKAKLFTEQGGKCLYSGESITIHDALNEEECEVEHFIPRSHFWNNSQKNTILVLKKHNQNKTDEHPIEYLKRIGRWNAFKEDVQRSQMQTNKKEWLTDEEKITSIFDEDSAKFLANYLNDTRSAIKIIKNYLEHYLFPKENRYGKGEFLHIKVVSAKAVNELKHIWGLKKLIASEETGKKDRQTNYHHSVDALTVALCDNKAAFALNNYFKQKENRFKTAAMKEKAAQNIPVSDDGKTLFAFTSELVEKYKNNELYVCPMHKIKTNKRGFKDGNKKLIVAKNAKGVEQLQEIQKISLLPYDLLQEKKNLTTRDRNDKEVRDYIKSVQEKLDPCKQKRLIEALEKYGEFLIEKREEEKALQKAYEKLKNKQKNDKEKQDEELNTSIQKAKEEWENVSKSIANSTCYFTTKKGKKQIVRNVRTLSGSETKASTILMQGKDKTVMHKLDIESFENAKKDGKPFVCKENDYTLSVDIYSSEKQQFLGLKYFRSLANEVTPNFNQKYEEFEKQFDFSIKKGEVVAILDNNENIQYLATANGGASIAATNHKLNLDAINITESLKPTINANNIIKRAKIDFYGNFQIL